MKDDNPALRLASELKLLFFGVEVSTLRTIQRGEFRMFSK